jgi:hypothetical protein
MTTFEAVAVFARKPGKRLRLAATAKPAGNAWYFNAVPGTLFRQGLAYFVLSSCEQLAAGCRWRRSFLKRDSFTFSSSA